ncbi:MAG: Psp operon transcriptional activator [bacterium]|nr:Psp operon transcriptional activator [bacterium]
MRPDPSSAWVLKQEQCQPRNLRLRAAISRGYGLTHGLGVLNYASRMREITPRGGGEHHLFLPEALGESEAFLEFQERLSRVARVERPVLLIGERGTGKELAAARLHALSARWQGPMVELNCAALSPTLIESELFGHEEGAFTGASRRRQGRFEMAHQGTLFLDEIGNIPMEAQEKILRVVEYGRFERVGGTRQVQVDVRILGATNVDLTRLCEEGRFKRDLLDRLSFEVLTLPPLRERGGDILLLAAHFANRMAFELGRSEMPTFAASAQRALMTYSWPGNVRELKNVAERAVYRSDSNVIGEIVFNPFATLEERPLPDARVQVSEEPVDKRARKPIRFEEALMELEMELLQRALAETGQNQRKAAEALGLSYHQFRWVYRRHRKALESALTLEESKT